MKVSFLLESKESFENLGLNIFLDTISNRLKKSNSKKKSQDFIPTIVIKYYIRRTLLSWHRECCYYQVKQKLGHLVVSQIGESMLFLKVINKKNATFSNSNSKSV